jgi:PAS domain S-box-containing protein
LDPYLYSFSPLSVCSFFTVGFLLLFSSWGLALNPRTRTNQSFFLMCLPVIVWMLGVGFTLSTRHPLIAERWYRLAYLGVVFVSPGVFFFTSTITRQLARNRVTILVAYALALPFGLEGLLGDLSIAGMREYEWGFYPRPGHLSLLFLIFFLVLMVASFRNLLRRMKTARSGIEKRQVRTLLFAFSIAYLGAWDFLPAVGIPVYPFGFLAIFGYMSLFFWSVYRDQLLNPSPESLSREVLATIADSIIVLDAEGYIRMVNPKAEELLGNPGHRLLRRHFSCFVDPQNAEVAQDLVKSITSGQRNVETGVVTLRDREGRQIPTSCTLSAIRDWKGRPLGFVLACRDLQEIVRSKEIIKEQQEKIRDTQERYAALFNRSLVCVYVHDLEGNFLDVNQATLDLLGYTREEIPALNLASVMVLQETPNAFDYFRQIIMKGRLDENACWKLRRKDGTFLWVEAESSLLYRQGKPYAIQGIVRDITARKKTEEDLKRHNEELKKLDEMKDSFLSSVSHELRTPLTSIRSFSEILLRYDHEDPATRKEFLGIIHSESERLSRLINDVLDLSRIEAGGMVWNDQILPVGQAIRGILPAHQKLLETKDLRLVLDLAPDLLPVRADRDRIQQVVANLLTNAVKFSRPGREIRIRTEALEGRHPGKPSPWIKVSVSDQGIGIDEKDFEVIFDKFRQVESDGMRDKPEGTGLGLHICKDIVLHYGGNIWVESEKGRGSTFCFTLPAAGAVAQPVREEATARKRQASNPTILSS